MLNTCRVQPIRSRHTGNRDLKPRPAQFSISILVLAMSTYWHTSNAEEISDYVQFTKDSLVVDSHIDTPFALTRKEGSVIEGHPILEFDYPKAHSGGLDVAFMAIYVPAPREDDGTAMEFANQLIDSVEEFVELAPDKFALASCTADIRKLKERGLIALPLGLENGAPIAGKFENFDHLIKRGIRYITLAHSKNNHIADSSYDDGPHWNGLSEFGIELVQEMNDNGIMVDISHLTDDAAWKVLEISKTPVVATHSSLRHFVPGFHRNISDEMVVAVAEAGGVVMINFGSGFVNAESRKWSDRRREISEELSEKYPDDPTMVTALLQTYAEENPYPYADVAKVVDHIDRVVELTSVDNVGLGSDFEGVGGTLPKGLRDASGYPNIVKELSDRGYSAADVKKILGENFMRFWSEIEKFAVARGNSVSCLHE